MHLLGKLQALVPLADIIAVFMSGIHLPTGRARLILLACLVTYLLLLLYPNLYLLGEPWNHALPGRRIVGAGRVHVLFVNILLIAMLFAMVRRAWIAVLVLAPFFVLLPMELFYISQFGTPTHAGVLGVIADTDPNEAMSWLGRTGVAVIGISVVALLAALGLAFGLWRAGVEWPAGRVRKVLGVWLPLVIGVPLVIGMAVAQVRDGMRSGDEQFKKAIAYRMGGLPRAMLISYPAGVPLRVVDFFSYQHAMTVIRQHVDRMSFGAKRAEALPAGVEREVYVMVVGESLRADHLQINGYPRETTPNLAAAGVISISNYVSAASVTREAVPPLFTRRLPQAAGVFEPEPTALKAFKEAGFKTYWLTTQAPFGKDDVGISMILAQADEVRSVSPEGWRPGVYDKDLLPWVDELLAKTDEPRQLIVLHTRGSHAQYSLRYPPNQAFFKPATPAGEAIDPWNPNQMESLRNAYDNSVRYTDAFVSQVMQRVKNATSDGGQGWLMFISDHGETLFDGQCGRASHGFASRPNFLPAAFFWPTDGYARTHVKEMAAMKANSGRPTDYQVVFHTLLDLADISVPVYDRRLSLASASFVSPERRLIDPSTGKVIDFDRELPEIDCAIKPGAPAQSSH